LSSKKKNPNNPYVEIPFCNGRYTDIKTNIAILQTDITWIKEKLNTLDKRVWYIVTGIIVAIILNLLQMVEK